MKIQAWGKLAAKAAIIAFRPSRRAHHNENDTGVNMNTFANVRVAEITP